MPQLRSPDCDCPGAAVGYVSESGSGDTDFYDTYDLAGGSPAAQDVDLVITFDAFTRKDWLIVTYTTASTGPHAVLDSSCISGNMGGPFPFTLPAGAVQLQVTLTASCDPGETSPPNEWVFTLDWQEERCP